MDNYENLKEYTYLFLLNDKYANELIKSIITILYYNDKCIEKNNKGEHKLLVTKKFIENCNKNIIFLKNNNKISKLSEIDKFKIIRDKLAHGDFVINKDNNIMFKIRDKEVSKKLEEDIETEISIYNINDFAYYISQYYMSLDARRERKSTIIKNGFEYEFIDKPKKGSQRNDNYNSRFYIIVKYLTNPKNLEHFTLAQKSITNTTNLNPGLIDIDYKVKETNKKDTDLLFPYKKDFEKYFFTNLYDNNQEQSKYRNFLNNIIEFYKYYIYPLENFLKKDDKNITSLQNDNMFNFETIDLPIIDNYNEEYDVGKVKSYMGDIDIISDKLKKQYERLTSLENNKYYKDKNEIETIKKQINELVKVLTTNSVMNIYNYKKNRSIIEHLRCSITHGTYEYDINSDTIYFIDNWNSNKKEIKITNAELSKMLCYNNKNIIAEQYENVYKKKIY